MRDDTGALRWLVITYRDGFNSCVVRRERRVPIDEAAYFEWLEKRRNKMNVNECNPDHERIGMCLGSKNI